MIRVVIADDHELVREGLRSLLAELPGIEVVGEGSNGREAIELVRRVRPDVLIVDLVMPEADGVEVTREVAGETRVLILTNFLEGDRVREALRAGALGYLLKDVLRSELQRAIEVVASGRPHLHPDVQRQVMAEAFGPASDPLSELTPRERAVLRRIALGRSNKEIAADLGVSEGTVKGYASAVFVKLGVSDRTQAALFAVQHGLAAHD